MDLKNSSSCFLTGAEDRAILVTKIVLLVLSLVLNIIAISVLLYFKSNKRFVFRLVLCLLFASLFGVIAQLLELIPPDGRSTDPMSHSNWLPTCSAFGFLDQVTIWMSNFVIIWIVGYLCWLMIQPEHKINMFQSKVEVPEVIGINLCFFLPFTFNWIPFTTNYFGASGHWCWIKLTKTAHCNDTDISEGAAYIFIFYYGPLMLIMLVTSVISAIAVVVWCKNLVKHDHTKGLIFIVVYPILFNVVGCIVTANRIYEVYNVRNSIPPSFGLWMAHAATDPARTYLPALFALLQFFIPTTRKIVMQSRQSDLSRPLSRVEDTLLTGNSTVLYSSSPCP